MPTEITACRICRGKNLEPILSLGQQYLTGVFPKSANERLTCGPLELVKCHGEEGCGLVQLRHSYESAEMYGANYGYRSSLNRSMVRHLGAKVEALRAKFPVGKGDLVLDIGSNDGTLLSFYPTDVTSVGMDPTAAKFRSFYKPHIQVITDFFSAETFFRRFQQKAKIITSIAMFYDLEEPIEFVRQIEQVLAEDGVWHFEQSYMPTMLEQNAYDTVCHEHLEYYGLRQVDWMLSRSGLKILDVELNDVNGGSFAVTAAKSASKHAQNTAAITALQEREENARLETLAPYQKFEERVHKHRDELLHLLDRVEKEKAMVLGYGASTKGNVILQFCGLTAERIPAIAEVNPDKFGSVTPGSNIPIISESDAHARKPDYFLVMPWHFRANLLEREAKFFARGGKMIFPLPAIEVVG